MGRVGRRRWGERNRYGVPLILNSSPKNEAGKKGNE